MDKGLKWRSDVHGEDEVEDVGRGEVGASTPGLLL